MRICPMCGMPRLEEGVTECKFCGFEDKPLSALSKKQVHDLMASYEYETTEYGGIRIIRVKNIRDIALRGFIALPSVVTEIESEAFSCCKFLAGVELPEGLRRIGSNAFSYCRDLGSILIPASVTDMGSGVFSDCYDLRAVRCAAPEKPEGWADTWLDGCSARVRWSCREED